MQKQDLLYKGKAKSVYETEDNDLLILHFRDDTSALDGKRIEQLARKGVVNNRFNAFIMQKLADAGIRFPKLEGVVIRTADITQETEEGKAKHAILEELIGRITAKVR